MPDSLFCILNNAANLLIPEDASSWRYLKITPLNVGETVTLDWHWELPLETGNVAQGDRLSFTINYTLEEFPPPQPAVEGGMPDYYLQVDLGGEKLRVRTTSAGEVRSDLEVVSADEMVTLYISKGVLAQTEDGQRLRKIEVLPMAEPPPPPENGYIIGIAYDFRPDGATFDPAIELEMRYDPSQIPDGLDEEDLLIAYYDEKAGEWIVLECVVDTEANIIVAKIGHFTAFAVLGYYEVVVVPPVLPVLPATFTIRDLTISPGEVYIGAPASFRVIVVNTGGESGSYEVTLEINGVVEETKEITVAAGVSKEVTFTTSKGEAGSYLVDINGLSGSFTIVERPSVTPQPPPPTPPAKPFNWWLIGGIIGGVVVIGLGIFFWTRRRAA